MKILIQRVKFAEVSIAGVVKDRIEHGLCLFLGIGINDTIIDAQNLCKKLCDLRIFSDANGKMNLSVLEQDADILVVSQFTLFADTTRGNRPSFTNAAPAEIAKSMYENFIQILEGITAKRVASGVFGADMQINLCNDGPVTIMLDSKVIEN
jgi:D-tyrosyl-tRNA(Tyr) deacylase